MADDRIRELIAKGLEAYGRGDSDFARAAWREALTHEPGNTRVQDYLRLFGAPKAAAPTPGYSGHARATNTGWDDGAARMPSELDLAPREGLSPLEDAAPLALASEPVSADSGLAEPVDGEVESWMEGVRDLVSLGDYTGALELCDKVLARVQTHAEAHRVHGECEATLTQMFESTIGPMDGVPSVAIAQDEVIWLNLDHRAGFVLAQIDGRVSYDDLYAICGMARFDTAKILAQLIQEGVIKTA